MSVDRALTIKYYYHIINRLLYMFEITYSKDSHNVTLLRLPPHLHNTLLKFLPAPDLQLLITALQGAAHHQALLRLAKTRLVATLHLQRGCELSAFAVLDSEQYRLHMDNHLVGMAGGPSCTHMYECSRRFGQAVARAGGCVGQAVREEFVGRLQQMFLEPCTPLPRLVRENMAGQVVSPFQNYLLHACQNPLPAPSPYEEVFKKIQAEIERQQQAMIKGMLQNPSTTDRVFEEPYRVKSSSIGPRLLPQNGLHNLVVWLLGATQALISLHEHYLASISDPFEQLLQLVAAYSRFQNTLIEVEQSLGFIFTAYDRLYRQAHPAAEGRLTFWKSAMVMWVHRMHKFHPSANRLYANVLARYLEPGCRDGEHQLDHWIYLDMERQLDDVVALLNGYSEYLVDLSLNESSIYLCGHSECNYGTVYGSLEQLILSQQKFKKFKLQECKDKESILASRFEGLQKILRPATLRKIIGIYGISSLQAELQLISARDDCIQRYIEHLPQVRLQEIGNQTQELFKLAFKAPRKENQSLATTTDSWDSDVESIEYQDSDQENEQERLGPAGCREGALSRSNPI